MPFQTSVATVPAPAVAGDFASSNPRFFVPAGPGGLVTGAAGVTVARFAWLQPSPLDPNGAPMIVNNFGSGQPAGLVHRSQQALLTIYLAETSMLIPPGFGITLFSGGDMWVKNDGTTEVIYDSFAYANFADGKVSFGAAASGATASGTASSIAAGTGSATGTITGNIMTVGTVTGTMNVGGILTGTGVATGTTILNQITGVAGAAGTYTVSIPDQTVASTTISETHGVLTVGGTIVGVFGVGDVLSGSGVTTGTMITALGTGTGGAGTYIVQTTQTAGSTTITAALSYQTKWRARSTGPAGALIKMSDQLLG
jgi:hypothetical protein